MSGHTAGPWTACDDDGTGTLPCVLSDHVNAGGKYYVAQCNLFADAHLIAAAPELLEALRSIEKSIVIGGEPVLACRAYELTIARAAIAKAEGR